jgi:TetR/AcrR family acrAB operon transcriptional repressor
VRQKQRSRSSLAAPQNGTSGTLRQTLQHQYREACRDAILDAAEQVFVRRGCREAKVTDIAEQAGVSVGTLYNYFPSKDEVFESLFDRGRARFFDLVEQVPSADSPLEQLQAALERAFGFIEEHGLAFTMYLRLGSAAPSETTHFERLGGAADRARYTALLGSILSRAVEAGQLRSDVEPTVLASGLYSLMNGLLFAWVNRSETGLVRHVPTLLKLFLEGAGKK